MTAPTGALPPEDWRALLTERYGNLGTLWREKYRRPLPPPRRGVTG